MTTQATNASGGPARGKGARQLSSLTVHAALIALSIIFMLPFVWMVSSSFKPASEIFVIPPRIIPHEFRPQNYLEAVTTINFFGQLKNTLIYSFFAVVGALFSNTMVGYGFSRVEWKGRDVIFVLVLATMMLPFAVRMIPLYVLFHRLGWLNTLLPLIVPAYMCNPYLVFLSRQFFMTLPTELDDAARIDGCSEVGIFWRIALPLSKPVLAVIFINELMFAWNNFIGPLIYLRDPQTYTLSVGLQLYFTQHGAEWALLMAAGTLFTLPMIILFFFAQRLFIEGITLTGIKG
jgi:multiple sugar transport system permease protein